MKLTNYPLRGVKQSLYTLLLLLSIGSIVGCSFDDELSSAIIPLDSSGTYVVKSNSIVYYVTSDTVNAEISYLFRADTVYLTTVTAKYSSSAYAESYYALYSADPDIQTISIHELTIQYCTNSYNGLAKEDIINLLEGAHYYDPNATEDTDSTYKTRLYFRVTQEEIEDGMRVVLVNLVGNSRGYAYFGNHLMGELGDGDYRKSNFQTSKQPWRLCKANDTKWYIQLNDSTYLKRSGNSLSSLVLTKNNTAEKATAWSLKKSENINYGFEFRNYYNSSKNYYGIWSKDDGSMVIEDNNSDSFALFATKVTLNFYAQGKLECSTKAYWGSSYTLPSTAVHKEGATFLGWNKTENTIEGFLPAGSTVEAEDANYYAIFAIPE